MGTRPVWQWRVQPRRLHTYQPRLPVDPEPLWWTEPCLAAIFSHFASLLTDLTRRQQSSFRCDVSILQRHEPAVLAHVASILAYVASVRVAYIAVVLSNFTELFADVTLLLAYVAQLQPYLADAFRCPWCNVSSLQPHVSCV